jgi:hypothetical protein
MRNLQFRELSLASATLVLAAGLTLTACSSSGGTGGSTPPASSPATQPASQPATSPPTSSAPATGSSEPSSGAGAIAAIKANWIAFFSANTPTARRIELLQNGSVFSVIIKAQAGSSLAALASAKVTSVSLTGTDQAGVVYSILVSGQSELGGEHGVAVYQDGIWKVGDASFCGLLTLEGTSGLPSACSG